jgi:hypothetical protein
VSKERARRRAARAAEAERRRREAERRTARVARRRALRARIPRRGRVGRLARRRTRGQLAGIALVLTIVLALSWYLVDAWPVRIAVLILALVALPALVTLTLDRSTR